MIATLTTPALAPANDAEAATVTATRAATNGTAILHPRKLGFLIASLSSLSSLQCTCAPFFRFRTSTSSDPLGHASLFPLRSGTRGGLVGFTHPVAASSKPTEAAIPDPHQASGRDEHDDEKDDPDDGVERPAEECAAEAQPGDREVAHVVLDHDEHERAEPGALDAHEAADHRHHEQVDRLGQVDVAGSDLPAPPHVENAAERRDERREAERERAVQRNVVAERGH